MARSDLLPPAEPWWTDSFMVTFAFRCNLACTFCMVEDVLGVYEGTSVTTFRHLVEEGRVPPNVQRVIFSGGEVTLSAELPEYVRLARSIPGVAHVRLQTNAVRLASRPYLDSLLEAGVDEFFVSLHAASAATCDAITQRAGSLQAILAGMTAVRDAGAALITNTALVAANCEELPRIVELAAGYAPRSMEFWNYWPRVDDPHAGAQMARVGDIRPHLLAALEACLTRGIPPVVKWFPRCLLGDLAIYQDNGQPPAMIADGYWDRVPRYDCVYAGVCREAPEPCSGLSHAYIRGFGWEEDVLEPRRTIPRPETLPIARGLLARAPDSRRTDPARWLSGLGLCRGDAVQGWALVGAGSTRAGELGVLHFAKESRQADVLVLPSDPGRRCLVRTPRFDVSYLGVDHEADVVELALAVARRLGLEAGG